MQSRVMHQLQKSETSRNQVNTNYQTSELHDINNGKFYGFMLPKIVNYGLKTINYAA